MQCDGSRIRRSGRSIVLPETAGSFSDRIEHDLWHLRNGDGHILPYAYGKYACSDPGSDPWHLCRAFDTSIKKHGSKVTQKIFRVVWNKSRAHHLRVVGFFLWKKEDNYGRVEYSAWFGLKSTLRAAKGNINYISDNICLFAVVALFFMKVITRIKRRARLHFAAFCFDLLR